MSIKLSRRSTSSRRLVPFWIAAAGFAVAGLLAVAAYGSSSKSPKAAAAGAKAPIKLMVMGVITSPAFSLPSVPVGAEIAVREINKAGGVNGHKLELKVCNDQNNPDDATSCAREAISDKVVALVGGLEDYITAIDPALIAAGIPWVGLISASDFTGSNLFLFGGTGATVYAGIGQSLAKEGCKKIADVVTAVSGTAGPNSEQIVAGIRAGGAKVAGKFTTPTNSVDYAPIVSAVRAAGAECIASGVGPSEAAPLITAVKAGAPLKMAFAAGGLPEELLSALGSAANGVYALAGTLPDTSSQGNVPKFTKTMKKDYPKDPVEEFATTGYNAVRIIADVAKGLKNNITAATVKRGLVKVKDFNTGFGPVVSFTKPNTVRAYSRIFDPNAYVWVAKNGKFVAGGKPIDEEHALKILGK